MIDNTALVSVVALAIGCGCGCGCARSADQRLALDDVQQQPPPEFEARSAALVDQLQAQLGQALQREMQAGGPAHAIEICSETAPSLSRKLSEGGLTIRRIGTRVRNPATGTPPAAASAALARLTRESPSFVGKLDGRWSYMRAIFISMPVCLSCHGDPASLAAPVKEQLASRYPGDTAVGYAMGDLRGAFLVQETHATPAAR